MSVAYGVKGIRDQGQKLREMASVKVQCDKHSLSYPPELVQYFGAGSEALDSGTVEDIMIAAASISLGSKAFPGVCSGEIESGDGLTIDLSKLPEDIKKLRIYMR